ncbi:MAG: hypothetical protein ABL998_13515 [Planctomycetota bacterium]
MKSIIKREQVKVDGPGAQRAARTAAPAGSEPACAGAASARLVRLDEHTQAIEFTCACGEVSLIEIQPPKKP